MNGTLIVVLGPITTATRFSKKLLERERISARVVHTPEALGGGGCSYSLRTEMEVLPRVMQVAKDFRFRVKGYYWMEGEGNYHALS